ncbi:MAG: quinone oxidoreductase [Methylocystaceae bacterium]|nr:quinone oxidoreductase [Methylocystaceae bacterium]
MDIKVDLLRVGGTENLAVSDCPVEDPQAGEIRVRQTGIGVNFIDIYQRMGLYPLPLPATLGVEGAGIVEAIGAGVDGLDVGDHIAYAGVVGGYRATRLLPAWRAIKLPKDLNLDVAAVSFLKGMTAHMLLTQTYPVQHGTVLLIHAAAGGLGGLLTRWAKHLGAEVIGTVSSQEKADIATANGCDHIILGRDAELVKEVKCINDGQGVDYVIDGIGGTMLRKSFECTRPFGTVASIGQVAGPIPDISMNELRCLSLAAPSVMAYGAQQDRYKRAGQAVLAALDQNIFPEIGLTLPLAEAAKAQDALEDGKTSGSVLLVL